MYIVVVVVVVVLVPRKYSPILAFDGRNATTEKDLLAFPFASPFHVAISHLLLYFACHWRSRGLGGMYF